jgi:hypothetical protein
MDARADRPYDRAMRLLRRRRPAVRPITEQAAYSRLHGERGGDVTVMPAVPRRPRAVLRVTGEQLRRSFEEKLASRGGG